MGNRKSKSKIYSFALVLMLTIPGLLASLSTVNALEFETYPFIHLRPDPVGVDQTVLVTMFLTNVPPAQFPEERPRYGYWNGFELTIEKPDGTIETTGPFSSGEAGVGWTEYIPDQVGTYSFYFTFPGQTIEVGPSAGDYYKPSTSPTVQLVVQEEPITDWPSTELPTDYWETPIYGENREWSQIAGNWLGGNYYDIGGSSFNPYTTAPNSPHILWTKQEMFGGIAGGEMGGYSWYTGRRPSDKFLPPLVIGGRLYYNNLGYGQYGSASESGFSCVDLYTGETLWTTDEGTLTIGQVYYFWSVAQSGVFSYLWSQSGSTWELYEAFSGDYILDIENVTSGASRTTTTSGPNGELLVYILNSKNNWLAMWNSTKLLLTGMRVIGAAIDWTPTPGTYDFKEGIQWNVTIPDVAGNPSISKIGSGVILATATFSETDTNPLPVYEHVAYDAETGAQLWVQNRTNLGEQNARATSPISEGVYTMFVQETMQHHGFDAYTGEELWVTEPYTNAFGMYAMCSVIANGKLYSSGYDGMVHCYDITNGKHLWDWTTGSSGLETPYGGWPLHGWIAVADGKVYAFSSEHTPSNPIWRGGDIYCIDAETGNEIWRVSGYRAESYELNAAVAYGSLVYLNGYDGQLYCFGKGPSTTTVSAPQTAVTEGSSVLITGTVTDQSPGQKGAACVSDASMSEWMEYLHMQKPIPGDATGVTVKVTAIDPNGNYQDIGTATTDLSGGFGIQWTPPVEGQYQVTATFEGTESYGSSFDITYLVVDPAPAQATPIEPEEPVTEEPVTEEPVTDEPITEPDEPATESALITTETAIIAAIAIAIVISAVSIFVLRKRK
ncbi:MAG: PQQ-binding-like beta-propeller repeat protein [Candidatus Bathyarchaeota archaeon]|nr:PQQ-binding-like beta-propeller repeat protein [Candidatus Bathyarchaeum sp.]